RSIERCHLSALSVADPPLRIEKEDVDRRLAAARGERGGAGVARGRADDCYPLAAPRQRCVEEQAQELQRQILERQRRSVKQLEEPQIAIELDQRRDRVMAESAVGGRAQPAQFGDV